MDQSQSDNLSMVHLSHHHQKGKPCDFQFWIPEALGASEYELLRGMVRSLSEDKRPFYLCLCSGAHVALGLMCSFVFINSVIKYCSCLFRLCNYISKQKFILRLSLSSTFFSGSVILKSLFYSQDLFIVTYSLFLLILHCLHDFQIMQMRIEATGKIDTYLWSEETQTATRRLSFWN